MINKYVVFLMVLIALIGTNVNAQFRAAPVNVTVDIFEDSVDVNPGDGLCADSLNHCSLRAAIMEANAVDPGSTIHLLHGFYSLTLPGSGENAAAAGDLDILTSMTIINDSGDYAYIFNKNTDGVFHVTGALTFNLTGVNVADGNRAAENGGNLWISGSQTIVNLTRVDLLEGSAVNGGGISVEGGATLNMERGAIAGHSFATSATSNGGGLYITGSSTVNLANVTIYGNTSDGAGAGIAMDSGSLDMNNVTIYENNADTGTGGLHIAGGIVSMSNTLVGGNQVLETVSDCSGTLISNGNNLIGTSTGCALTGGSGDLVDIDPGILTHDLFGFLHPGTSTVIVPLLETSAAYNGGNPATCETVDQRGIARPQGAQCDIGAHEGYARSLVLNPSFEIVSTEHSKLPASWKFKGLTSKDGRKCNTEEKTVANDGECAFSFTSAINGTKTLRQMIIPTDLNTDDGLFITMGMGVTSPNENIRIKVTIKVNYVDPALTDEIYTETLFLSESGPHTVSSYTARGFSVPGVHPALKGEVAEVIVSFKHTRLTQRFYIDNVNIYQIENHGLNYSAGGGLLALPPVEGQSPFMQQWSSR